MIHVWSFDSPAFVSDPLSMQRTFDGRFMLQRAMSTCADVGL